MNLTLQFNCTFEEFEKIRNNVGYVNFQHVQIWQMCIPARRGRFLLCSFSNGIITIKVSVKHDRLIRNRTKKNPNPLNVLSMKKWVLIPNEKEMFNIQLEGEIIKLNEGEIVTKLYTGDHEWDASPKKDMNKVSKAFEHLRDELIKCFRIVEIMKWINRKLWR